MGFVSRSGTLTYEVVALLTAAGLGQSSVIGIGGDPIIGTTLHAHPARLRGRPRDRRGGDVRRDRRQRRGGRGGVRAGRCRSRSSRFISGRTAPPGKRMGHAGAIISGKTGTAQGKVEALQAAGVPVAETIFDIPEMTRRALDGAKSRA